jgi:hypothetical protein
VVKAVVLHTIIREFESLIGYQLPRTKLMTFIYLWLAVFLAVVLLTVPKRISPKTPDELFNLRWSEDMNDLEFLISGANDEENDDEDTQFHTLMMDAYDGHVVPTRILAELFDDYQNELDMDRDHPHDPTQIFW